MRLALCAATLAIAAIGAAQTGGLLDTRKNHYEALQSFDLKTFAVGHGRLKSYWRADAFTGLDTSKSELTANATVYGAGVFLQVPIQAHVLVPNLFDSSKTWVNWHWSSGWTLLIGLGAQVEYKQTPHSGLYLGLQF